LAQARLTTNGTLDADGGGASNTASLNLPVWEVVRWRCRQNWEGWSPSHRETTIKRTWAVLEAAIGSGHPGIVVAGEWFRNNVWLTDEPPPSVRITMESIPNIRDLTKEWVIDLLRRMATYRLVAVGFKVLRG